MQTNEQQNLPAPRLQMRWEVNQDEESRQRFQYLCHYELVMPLGEHDIRREVYGEDGEMTGKLNELVVPMGGPSKRGCATPPCVRSDGELYFDEPYRDGAHAKWDAEALGGLPVWVIALDGTPIAKPSN